MSSCVIIQPTQHLIGIYAEGLPRVVDEAVEVATRKGGVCSIDCAGDLGERIRKRLEKVPGVTPEAWPPLDARTSRIQRAREVAVLHHVVIVILMEPARVSYQRLIDDLARRTVEGRPWYSHRIHVLKSWTASTSTICGSEGSNV